MYVHDGCMSCSTDTVDKFSYSVYTMLNKEFNLHLKEAIHLVLFFSHIIDFQVLLYYFVYFCH